MIDTLTSVELCRLTKITHRQLDYWVRTGLLKSLTGPRPGSGRARRFDIAVVPKVQALKVILRVTHVDVLRTVLDDTAGPWIIKGGNVRITIEVGQEVTDAD